MESSERAIQDGVVAMHSTCGICASPIVLGEMIIGLLGSDDSSRLASLTRAFPLGPPPASDGFDSDSGPGPGLESAAVHATCLSYFGTLLPGPPSDLLWRATAWRAPWIDGHVGILDPPSEPLPRSALAPVATACGLPRLADLPPELVLVVRAFSPRAPFWNLVEAGALAARLSRVAPGGKMSVFSAGTLRAWERGEEPTLVSDGMLLEHKHGPVRVTVDARGIRSVERLLNTKLRFSPRRVDHLVFAVIDARQFARMSALFVDGMLRLVPPRSRHHPDLWDLPAPPLLDTMEDEGEVRCVYEPVSTLPLRLATVDLAAVTGLTFLMSDKGATLTIHGHTAEKPFAAAPAGHEDGFAVWVYVPLAKGEEVLAVATRGFKWPPPGQPSFLLRTMLVGDVAIGPWFAPSTPPSHVSERPEVLVLGQSRRADGEATGVGFAPATGRSAEEVFPRSCLRFVPSMLPPSVGAVEAGDGGERSFFSSARLSGVKVVSVFWSGAGECMGAELEYGDGGRRAVGEVRLGVDEVRVTEGPRRVCSARDRVEFHGEEECEVVGEGRVCRGMEGWVLRWWFWRGGRYVEVVREVMRDG